MSRQKQRVIPNGVQSNGTDGIDAKALASLPLEDIKKRLGFAADGLADEEAKAEAYPLRSERTRGGNKSNLEVPLLFLGTDSLDDRGSRRVLRTGAPLGGLCHHHGPASGERRHWFGKNQAGNTIAALKAKLAINARVKRAGNCSRSPRANSYPET